MTCIHHDLCECKSCVCTHEAKQAMDTPTLEQFQNWLNERCNSIASEAAHPWITPADAIHLEREYSIPFGAKKLLVEFMLEHHA